MVKLANGQLTFKQQLFVEEMVNDDRDHSVCAVRAGYSPKSARQQACNMLANPKIKEAIEETNLACGQRVGITKERVMQELALMAFANLKNVLTEDEFGHTTVNLHALQDEAAAALSEVTVTSSKRGREVKVKLNDKQTALVTLARMMGWDKETKDVNVKLSLEQLIEQSFNTTPTIITEVQPLLLEESVSDD